MFLPFQALLDKVQSCISKEPSDTAHVPPTGPSTSTYSPSNYESLIAINSSDFNSTSEGIPQHGSPPLGKDLWVAPVMLSDGAVAKGGSALTEIEWLLRGVPEVFDEDVEVDDALVTRLLQQGGAPPSQLIFPSMQYATQRSMKRLESVRALRITITQIHINSYRCGVRKGCGFLLLHPPSGCLYDRTESPSTRVDLSAAFSPSSSHTDDSKRKFSDSSRQWTPPDKKVAQRQYISGDVNTHLTTIWPVQLSDAVLSQWLACERGGLCEVELYSFLTPPTGKHNHSEPILFGRTSVPLGGILGTESLDAVVTCPIDAEAKVMEVVSSRIRKDPLYRGSNKYVPSNQESIRVIGNITFRLTLLKDETEPPLTYSEKASIIDETATALPIPIIAKNAFHRKVEDENFAVPGRSEIALDEALAFLPLEARRIKARAAAELESKNNSISRPEGPLIAMPPTSADNLKPPSSTSTDPYTDDPSGVSYAISVLCVDIMKGVFKADEWDSLSSKLYVGYKVRNGSHERYKYT